MPKRTHRRIMRIKRCSHGPQAPHLAQEVQRARVVQVH